MPRKKRERDENLPHHVMCRSIPELQLFTCKRDKDKYLSLIKEATIEFQFDIIAYCLMDSHLHLLLHPKGADISKIMRKINNSYAKYYNRVYNRRGHLFGDRFKSKPITDEQYFLRVSTYIHSNAKDIIHYADKIEEYTYSSLGIYLGIHKDIYEMVAVDSIFKHLGGNYKQSSLAYAKLMEIHRVGKDDFEQKIINDINNNMEYRNEKRFIKRNINPEMVLKTTAEVMGLKDYNLLRTKHSNEYNKYECIASIAIRALCNVTRREVAHILGNISLSNVTVLSKKGIKLLDNDDSALFTKIIEAL